MFSPDHITYPNSDRYNINIIRLSRYSNNQSSRIHMMTSTNRNSQFHPNDMKTVAAVTLTTIATSSEQPSPDITIYQYHICPFCNRVKALLDYSGTHYHTVEVNPLTKNEIKQFKKQYQKVPIVTIASPSYNDNHNNINNNNDHNDNEQHVAEEVIFGSDEIIMKLLERHHIISMLQHRWQVPSQQQQQQQLIMSMNEFWNPAMLQSNTNKPQQQQQHDWNHFAIEVLAPVIYPNLCRTLYDSYQAFSYVHQVSSFTKLQQISIRSLGSLAMYFAASRVKKKRHILNEEKAFDDALYYLIEYGLHHGAKPYISDHPYEPNFHDIQIFGILRSIEDCHANVHHRMTTHPNFTVVSQWYHRMKEKMK